MAASLAIRHSLHEIPHLLTSETLSWGFKHLKLEVFILSSDYIFIWLKKTLKHRLGSVLQSLQPQFLSFQNSEWVVNPFYFIRMPHRYISFDSKGFQILQQALEEWGLSATPLLLPCPLRISIDTPTPGEQRAFYSRSDSVPSWWFFGQQEQDWYLFRHKCEKYNLLFWGTPTEQRWYHERVL